MHIKTSAMRLQQFYYMKAQQVEVSWVLQGGGWVPLLGTSQRRVAAVWIDGETCRPSERLPGSVLSAKTSGWWPAQMPWWNPLCSGGSVTDA